jgi:hypothetical protein
MLPDLEKGLDHNGLASSSSLTESTRSTSQDTPTLEPIRRPDTSHSRRSNATQRTGIVDRTDDIYEALEHALTPDQETTAEREAREPITYTRSGVSMASTGTRPSEFEVVFEEGDPENPKNWPIWYRAWIIFSVSFSTWVIVLYSTSYTAATPGFMRDFNASTTVVTLGVTTYLMGLAIGSLIFAPLSELYGRRTVYIGCMLVWLIFIIPAGVANSLTTIMVVRFFG